MRHAERKYRLNRLRVVAQKVMQFYCDDAQAPQQGAKGGKIVRTIVAKIWITIGILAEDRANPRTRPTRPEDQWAEPTRAQPRASLPDKALDSARQLECHEQHDLAIPRDKALFIEASTDSPYRVGSDEMLDKRVVTGVTQA